MRTPSRLAQLGLLTLVACGGGPETGLRAFDDSDPAYGPKRAETICEARAEEAAQQARQRALRTLNSGAWGSPEMDYAVRDVADKVRRSRLKACLAEFGYYRPDERR
jgi:hypothetical protein